MAALLLLFAMALLLGGVPIVALSCVIHYGIQTHRSWKEHSLYPDSEFLREKWKRNRFRLICSLVLLILIPLVVVGLGVIVGNSISFM